MILNLLGCTDKRILIYSLLKVLSKQGEVALISNNPKYKRLTGDYSSNGFLANVHIIVTDEEPNDALSENDLELSDFLHIIYDTEINIYEGADKYIYVKGLAYESGEAEFLESIEDLVTVNMVYGQKISKNDLAVEASSYLSTFIEKVEAYKQLTEVDSKQLSNVLYKLIGKEICTEEKTLHNLLKKGDVGK